MANRKIIQFMGKLFDESGINVSNDPNHTKKWRYIVVIMLLMMAEGSLMTEAFLNFTNLGNFIKLLGWISAGTIVIAKCLATLYLEKTLADVLHSLDESNEFVYPDEQLFDVQYSWYLEEEFIMRMLRLGVRCQILFSFFLSLPGLIDLLLFGKLRLMLYPGYIPWSRTDLISCWLALFYQLPEAIVGMWVNFLLAILPIVVMSLFLKQFQKLQYAICTLEYRTRVALEKYKNAPQRVNDIKFEDILRENIISCFKHHRTLRRNFQIFSIWFSAIFSCELIPSVTSFAFGILGALIDGNIGVIFIQIVLCAAFSMCLLTYCFIGEVFSGFNESIADAIFYEWTVVKMNKSNRQLVFIFRLMVEHPFEIFGCFVFGACLITFARIVRNVFSWFNVINATFKKRSI